MRKKPNTPGQEPILRTNLTHDNEEVREAMMAASILVNLRQLEPSATNPRKHFDEAKLQELAESIKTHGLLQPLLVRPKHEPASDDIEQYNTYEIVAGERRYRASVMAGVRTVPVLVRELSDREVLEVQYVENLQRDDLQPLEEAEGYKLLCEQHDYPVRELALKLGKHPSYVYNRMKLATLPAEAKEALKENEIALSTALLIARIPDAGMQKEAFKLSRRNRETSYANECIRNTYMLRLKDADFDVNDAQLVPKAGSCTDCPKRSGNARDLFPDVQENDTCLDAKCFNDKCAANWRSMKARKDITCLSDSECKRVFPYGAYPNGDYVDVKDGNFHDGAYKQHSWSTYMKSADAQSKIIFARDPNGRIRKLMKESVARKFAQKAGIKFASTRSGLSPSETARARQQKQTVEIAKLAGSLMADAIVTAEECAPSITQSHMRFWEIFTPFALNRIARFCPAKDYLKGHAELLKQYEQVLSKGDSDAMQALRSVVSGLHWRNRQILLLEMILKDHANSIYYHGDAEKQLEELVKACEAYDIDAKGIREVVEAEVKTAAAAEPKKKAKKSKTKPEPDPLDECDGDCDHCVRDLCPAEQEEIAQAAEADQ